MNSNFLKDYMDLDEFLAVKDLCTGLSRTESDYSEDEIDQDIANLVGDEDNTAIYGLPSSQFNTPQLSPSCFGSDTDEGRGESISSENVASLSSSESLHSNENDNKVVARKRKRKSTANDTATQKAAPRRRRRKTENADKKAANGASTAPIGNGGETSKLFGVGQRGSRQSVDDEAKDDKYWERRRKNNQAAKKSRDLKRQKEMCVAEKAAVLEEENKQLREEVKKLKEYLKTLDSKIGWIVCKLKINYRKGLVMLSLFLR